MKFETFKAGAWTPRYQYKSFEPVLVDHAWIWEDPTINALLESANRALGELNAFSLIVPDIDLFIEMHVVKEAQTSSRIEGTQTGMDEALMTEDQIQPEKRDDWREVRNYVDAVNGAIAELQTLPLSNRLLRKTHEILMRGVRGENKQPGEFRISQNWIGGTRPGNAYFVPPPAENVLECLNGRQTTVALNWARSAIEGRSTQWPLRHTQQTVAAGKLTGLMFSGTTCQGPYGEWQDLHAPFSSFCADSLMSTERAKALFTAASAATLKFSGIKLLEINANADVSHRIAILRDGISAMNKAKQ